MQLPPMRKVLAFLASVARIYACVAIVLILGQRYFVFPAWVPAITHGNPMTPLGTTRVVIETGDGEKLVGFWRAPTAGMPVVVTFHGNASSVETHAERFSGRPWSDAGWGMLAIAYRGYPGSTGSPDETGLIEDGKAAVRYARQNAPAAPLLLHGHSLGAAVAIAVAPMAQAIALYLEAPFTSVKEMVETKVWWLPSSLVWDTYRSDLRVGTVKEKIVVYHGSDDPVAPPSFGKRISTMAPNGEFHLVESRDHLSIMGSRDTGVEERFRPKPAPGSP